MGGKDREGFLGRKVFIIFKHIIQSLQEFTSYRRLCRQGWIMNSCTTTKLLCQRNMKLKEALPWWVKHQWAQKRPMSFKVETLNQISSKLD